MSGALTAGLQFLTSSSAIITDDLKEYLLCSLRDGTACYSRYDALTVGFAICLFFTTYCFVWSIVGNNCSKVDQIWSIVPVLYCWHFFVHYSLNNKAVHYRLLLLSILVTLWGARLTFNFARKNGYGTFFEHEEDYRWPILRKLMHPVVFLLFNISFIASYQNLLLYYIAAPAYVVMKGPADNNIYDILVGGLFSIMLLIETVADEQHWIFQSYKHSLSPEERLKDADPQVREGFYRSGLFQFCRHPNYFAEQSMWVCVYLFTLTHNEGLQLDNMNWTITGCIQLILLFQGSISFSESITVSKYPVYREYQRTTSQLIPMPSFSSKVMQKKQE